MKLEVKLSGMDGILATLKSLPAEVVSKNGGPVKLALAKGARVLRDEAKKNLRASIEAPGKTGITERTGFTEKNVVAMRKNPPSGTKGERYIVTVKPAAHPSARKVKRASRRAANSKRRVRQRITRDIQANDIAFMMEYGTSKQAALPWLRPAFSAKAQQAIDVSAADLVKRVEAIVNKLSVQNASKK
ncbi:hypothetical protein [Bordetella genomosp. 9]|uniref:Phage protein, HK97 gp10 family n=1 Tax=Bordetella genomosp. 9 TaxID=1416803 RepID=A0A1W6YYV9_9BORD|nr:hypothetical protein [Bordetella genomosp. 9]ARP86295.1 hypothetical protein CAL13_08855 [Bordetella genomosp. 9]